jgi:hypothetical protein
MEQISIGQDFLNNSIKNFQDIKKAGDKAMAQIKDEDFFFEPNEQSNSIATIIKHLSGNMLSRWTDFLTTDGEKEWRHRDSEFDRIFYTDTDDIKERWEKGWECTFNALNSLTENDLAKTVYIRKEPHTVIAAINRQIYHYGYHIGQIVYLARFLAKDNWNTLTIPRGKSNKFNEKMMGK